MKTKIFFILVGLTASTYLVKANQKINTQKGTKEQVKVMIDLAQIGATTTYTVDNKKPFIITIVNENPALTYNSNLSIVMNQPPPLQNPTNPPNNAQVAGQNHDQQAACDAMYNELKNDKSEKDFAVSLAKAQTMASTCTAYDVYNKLSTRVFDPITLNNETLTLTITNNASPALTWTIIITTRQSGVFLTHYGLSYIPYWFAKPQTFYAQQYPALTPGSSTSNQGNGGQSTTTSSQLYKIAQGSSETVTEFVPSIMFTWASRNASGLDGSAVAGFGLGLNGLQNGVSPAAFLGYSFVYHYNYGFGFGIAAHTLTRLKGVYSSGEYITTNLESSDLNEQVVRFNPFFSLFFRFGSNPFPNQTNPPSLGGGN